MNESAQLARLRVVFDGLTVLVVDDDVACLEAFRCLLEQLGATVLVANDGIEALAVLRERRPDLVLSDIMMPRLDGYALVRRVRDDQEWTTLPMIAVSAITAADQRFGGDFDGNLGKPFDYGDLDRAIRQVILKRPDVFLRQFRRLRALATATRARARDLRAIARRRVPRATRPGRRVRHE